MYKLIYKNLKIFLIILNSLINCTKYNIDRYNNYNYNYNNDNLQFRVPDHCHLHRTKNKTVKGVTEFENEQKKKITHQNDVAFDQKTASNHHQQNSTTDLAQL